jgi:hypothetical protein
MGNSRTMDLVTCVIANTFKILAKDPKSGIVINRTVTGDQDDSSGDDDDGDNDDSSDDDEGDYDEGDDDEGDDDEGDDTDRDADADRDADRDDHGIAPGYRSVRRRLLPETTGMDRTLENGDDDQRGERLHSMMD